jgi:Kef-type K+ transport system membrane component KefB
MQRILLTLFVLLSQSGFATAVASASTTVSHNDYDPVIFLWLAVCIFLTRSMSIVKKIGLPLVVGEIFSGIILGDMHLFGINIFNSTYNSSIIQFLAELGGIILMFEIGIESKFSDLKRNFKTGFKVAITGTIMSFIGGFLISKFLISGSTLPLNLLIGIISAATATGISAKTFKEMGIIGSKEVKIVLVASILDEIISVMCFGVISSLIIDAAINLRSISTSFAQVIGFFVFAAIFGQRITPFLIKWSTKIHAGINMKIGVLFIICLLFSWIAHQMGVAAVIGAFIAGLILDQVYFKSFSRTNFHKDLQDSVNTIPERSIRNKINKLLEEHEERNLEELLKPLSHIFVPVFFIYIGMQLNLEKLFQFDTFIITIALLIVSFAGRIISGFLVRVKPLNKIIIGLGMTPVGEAGLIFAMFGKNFGIIDSTVLSAIVATLVIASIITPVFIKLAISSKGINYEQ